MKKCNSRIYGSVNLVKSSRFWGRKAATLPTPWLSCRVWGFFIFTPDITRCTCFKRFYFCLICPHIFPKLLKIFKMFSINVSRVRTGFDLSNSSKDARFAKYQSIRNNFIKCRELDAWYATSKIIFWFASKNAKWSWTKECGFCKAIFENDFVIFSQLNLIKY